MNIELPRRGCPGGETPYQQLWLRGHTHFRTSLWEVRELTFKKYSSKRT